VERLIDELPWPYNVVLAIIHETDARRGEILSRKSKPRTVIVVRRCQNLVREWFRKHLGRDDSEASFFHTKTGKIVRASILYMRLHMAIKKFGINVKICLYLLRHCRATEFYGKLSEKEMMQ